MPSMNHWTYYKEQNRASFTFAQLTTHRVGVGVNGVLSVLESYRNIPTPPPHLMSRSYGGRVFLKLSDHWTRTSKAFQHFNRY